MDVGILNMNGASTATWTLSSKVTMCRLQECMYFRVKEAFGKYVAGPSLTSVHFIFRRDSDLYTGKRANVPAWLTEPHFDALTPAWF